MNITKKDVLVLGIVAMSFSFIGASVMSLFKKDEVIIQQPDLSKYKAKEDSLIRIINTNKDSILVYKKHIFYTDSLMIVNRKKLTNDKKLIQNFTSDSRKRYLDSLFKSAGL
jgi:hypothetical protein